MTKNELNAELDQLAVMLGKIKSNEPLSEDGIELCEELFNKEIEYKKDQWKRDRVNKIVGTLFPRYDSRAPEEEKPIRLPGATHWWWNGVTIEEYDEQYNGDVKVNLKSYTGGGEYDYLNDFCIKAEWIEQENLKEFLNNMCLEMLDKINKEKKADALVRAARDLARAEAEVARLKADIK